VLSQARAEPTANSRRYGSSSLKDDWTLKVRRRLAFRSLPLTTITLLLGLGSVLTSCSSPNQSAPVNITVSAPPSLASAIKALARTYQAQGDGSVQVEVWDGAETVARLHNGNGIPNVAFSDNPTVDSHLTTPIDKPPISWYSQFATSPMVLAFESKDVLMPITDNTWTSLLSKPGIGHVDTAQDPEGQAAQTAIIAASSLTHQPVDLRVLSDPLDVASSIDLVKKVKSGDLFAAFIFQNEARVSKLTYAPITEPDTSALYTVSIPTAWNKNRGAQQFLELLLSPAGQADLKQAGLILSTVPTTSGNDSALPTALRAALRGVS
jgi:molybdate/tungstate transport system substrate-binding protein